MDLVIRTPERVRTDHRVYDVVEEHNAAFLKNGVVSFGKFGVALSEKVVKSIEAAIEGGSSRLYVVVKRAGGYSASSAIITSIKRSCDRTESRKNFPSYYNELDEEPTSCILLGSELEPASIADLRLATNGRALLDVLKRTRTSAMLVERT